MNSKWHEIWEKRNVDQTLISGGGIQEVLLELKRLDGYDSMGYTLGYEQFYSRHIQIKNELEFSAKSGKQTLGSIFEVGCGSGANLFLFQNEGIDVGGIDYSETLIKVAKTVLNNPVELVCDEAVNIPEGNIYDATLSNGVFCYFESYEYAKKVLEIMYSKTRHMMGITETPDLKSKSAFMEYRKSEVEDYEEKYKDLPKFFYDKSFFIEFAEEHNMDIKFTKTNIDGYWNNEFYFDCYMTKNSSV